MEQNITYVNDYPIVGATKSIVTPEEANLLKQREELIKELERVDEALKKIAFGKANATVRDKWTMSKIPMGKFEADF